MFNVCFSGLWAKLFRRTQSTVNNTRVFNRVMIAVRLVPLMVFIFMPYAAIAGTSTIMVAWEPPTDSVAGYEISYGTSSGNYDFTSDVGNNVTCSISSLEEGTTYYFAVKAYNTAGVKSEYSEELAYTIPVGNGQESNDDSADTLPDEQIISEAVKIWFEAENGSLNYPFEASFNSSALSEGFIWVPNGTGNSFKSWEASGYAEYDFEVPSDGNYVIWGRVIADGDRNDSFFIKVDNGNYSVWGVQWSQSWIWDKVNHRGGADPVVYYLEAGHHTLTIKQREDGTQIDKILVTGDMKHVP